MDIARETKISDLINFANEIRRKEADKAIPTVGVNKVSLAVNSDGMVVKITVPIAAMLIEKIKFSYATKLPLEIDKFLTYNKNIVKFVHL